MAARVFNVLRTFRELTKTQVLDLPFARLLAGPFTLAVTATQKAVEVDVTGGHTIVAGNLIRIKDMDAKREYLGTVIDVDVNELGLDTPLDFFGSAFQTLFILYTALFVMGHNGAGKNFFTVFAMHNKLLKRGRGFLPAIL